MQTSEDAFPLIDALASACATTDMRMSVVDLSRFIEAIHEGGYVIVRKSDLPVPAAHPIAEHAPAVKDAEWTSPAGQLYAVANTAGGSPLAIGIMTAKALSETIGAGRTIVKAATAGEASAMFRNKDATNSGIGSDTFFFEGRRVEYLTDEIPF